MGRDIFNRLAKFIRVCLSFFSCNWLLAAVQYTSSSSPTLAPIQTPGSGLPDTHSSSSSEPLSIPEPPSSRLTAPPFYALIIGINEYASLVVHDLEGAVHDALSVMTYIKEYLGVPDSQIRILCNADASRSAIIREFNNLIADRRIHRGDPILIFYAGYGGEVAPPDGWEAGNTKIQMIVPHDFGTDVDGQVNYGIPDRTIGSLLSRIAEKRGDNIVRLPKPYSIV